MLCYTGLAVSLFPYIIPPDITIWQAAAAPDSQLFMLYGAIPLLPIILGYTAYSYYVLWDALRARRLSLRPENALTICRAGRARRCGASTA